MTVYLFLIIIWIVYAWYTYNIKGKVRKNNTGINSFSYSGYNHYHEIGGTEDVTISLRAYPTFSFTFPSK
jgi:hypothetical protein